jgi:hypothetical protein
MATSKCANFETNRNSSTGGVIIITIADPAADITHTESQPCRSCLVQQQSGTGVYMNIETAAAAATGWKLSSTVPIAVPIDDVQKLHFFGTAADVVQIIWRN